MFIKILHQFYFSVNVESVGAMPPNVIFIEAVKILRDKCKSLLDELNTFWFMYVFLLKANFAKT